MNRLIGSQEICKALYYNDTNFLDQPDISNPPSLAYDYIYPYRFIPDETQTDVKNYITLSFRSYRDAGVYFKSGKIYINVLNHVQTIKTDYGWLRYDYLIHNIDLLMNSTLGIGIGKAEFYDADEFYVNKNYVGMYVAYKIVEFG